MDFLDPKKQKAHNVRIAIGYALLGVLLLLTTIVLLYESNGFGIDKNGQVIQSGFVFFSSQPTGSRIYVNGAAKSNTNARLSLAAGGYTVQLRRDGYRTWQRAVTVDGDSVERFDYPVLFPLTLKTTTVKNYAAAPLLASQSLDRRWLFVQASSPDQFDLYDLAQTPLAPKPFVIPSDTLSAGTTTTGWQVAAWSTDNRHFIVRRTYQKAGKTGGEFILVDRTDATLSQNLSVLFGVAPTAMSFKDDHYDQYYLYDQNAEQVLTATLKKPTPLPLIQDVVAYAADTDALLYATPDGAPAGSVEVRLQESSRSYVLRQLPAGSSYALKIDTYKGDRYAAVGSTADGRVYVYKNPATTLDAKQVVVPMQILKVPSVSALSFSTDSRFIVVENGQQFATYDALTNKAYAYTTTLALDAPQTQAVWMDDAHLDYVSGGKLYVLDFDGTNVQPLSAGNPHYLPFFDPDYHTLFTLNATDALTSTSLLTTN